MAKTLELQGMSLEVINQANAVLKAILANSDSKVQLSIANSLWSKQGFLFHSEFVHKSQEFYQAQVTDLDFNNPDAPSIINAWVKQSTNGKIDNIVEEISSAILILIDAIYFKSKWAEPFRESATEMRPFTLLDGTSKQHPLMSQSGQYQYLHNDLFQAVSLPYGAGRLSLYIFLPHKEARLQKQGSWVKNLLSLGFLFEPSQSDTNTDPEIPNTNLQSFKAFYDSLNVKNWEQWMTQFSSNPGSIALPRFKLEYDFELKDVLIALGMGVAFDKNCADFTNMSPEGASIDRVKHKTFVEVNEEGTEAAAVTVGMIAPLSAAPRPVEQFNMVVDRPFFCAIRDNHTEAILFMGSIVEPKV